MNIETIETTTTVTKLTIAKNRVTIKYPTDLVKEIKERQYRMVLKIVEAIQSPDMLTRRGRFFFTSENDKFSITMYLQSKKKGEFDPIVFYEEEN